LNHFEVLIYVSWFLTIVTFLSTISLTSYNKNQFTIQKMDLLIHDLVFCSVTMLEMFLQKPDRKTAWIDRRVCQGRARAIR